MAPNFPKGVIEPLHFAKFGQRSAAKGGFDSTKFSEGRFQKNWCYRTAAFSDNEDSEGRFDCTKFSEGCFQKIWCYRTAAFSDNEDSGGRFDSTKFFRRVFSENLVLSTRCIFQTMKTAKSGSIAPNFPKGVVAENLVLSNRCISENQDSEGRFDSTKFSEGCHRTAAYCKIWTAKRSEGRFDSTKFSEGRFQKIWCYRTAAFSDNEDSEGRFDSTKYSEGCFQKIWCYRTAAFSDNEDSEERFDSTKFSEWCRFRKLGAIEPLRFRKSGRQRAVR